MARRSGYGQFCPVSRAAEILAERWTPLVVRELLCGSTHFNQLRQGVPRMSTSLLARRLQELEHAGIVERRRLEGSRGYEYHLTPAGLELRPLVEGMGVWAQRWVRHELVLDRNLDPALLMWDLRRRAKAEALPAGARHVIAFHFTGVPSRRGRYWLLAEQGDVDVCERDPGFPVDLHVSASAKLLTQLWLGHISFEAAVHGGLKLEGERAHRLAFRDWFALSFFAEAGRQPPGHQDVAELRRA